jgi:hypothetical protein
MKKGLIAVVALAVGALLWAIRDPTWLADYTEGLRPVYKDETGRAARWTAGLASFYVPSEWDVTEIELGGPADYRTQASIYVDGRLAGRLLLDERWQSVPVATGATPTSRRHRRVDIHVARTSEGQNGVRLRWPVGKKETGLPR